MVVLYRDGFSLVLFYLPFDEWWYLRFLLPAHPPILVLSSAALVRLLTPLTRVAPDAKGFAAAAVVALVARHGVDYAVNRGAPDLWRAEQRYLTVGEYAATLPDRAVLICMQHSGAASTYSGRITVRYDVMRPTDLDLVLAELRRLGYYPYLVLDDWEEPKFRDRFQGSERPGRTGLDARRAAALEPGEDLRSRRSAARPTGSSENSRCGALTKPEI